jgi:signal peptidase I
MEIGDGNDLISLPFKPALVVASKSRNNPYGNMLRTGHRVVRNRCWEQKMTSFFHPVTCVRGHKSPSSLHNIHWKSQFRVQSSSQKKEKLSKILKDAQSSKDPFSVKGVAKEIGILLSRLAAAFGIHHIFSTYCVDFLVCEGPSMLPTIRQKGDIILIERFSHRWFGLVGGDKGEVRSRDARERQKKWEEDETERIFKEKENEASFDEITWHTEKALPCYPENYEHLSTLKRSLGRITSGISVGDVVVLEHPNHVGTVCKRVLGLPGDLVLRPKEDAFFRPMGAKHRQVIDIFQDNDREKKANNALSLMSSSLLVVPDGHIWVEGDNSLNSADSRDYGPVPASLVLGKVWMKIWPLRGNTLMVRGDRPVPPEGKPFTGSSVLPAGYEGELIMVEK